MYSPSRTTTSVRRQLDSVRHAINELYVTRDDRGGFTGPEEDRYTELVVAEQRLLDELRASSPTDH